MASQNLKKELKGLGADIAKAFKDAKESPEFKKLQKDLLSSLKSVSSSLVQAVQSAKKSPQTGKLKSRLKRVVKLSKKEGAHQAKAAEKAAAVHLKRARKVLKTLRKRMGNPS